MKINLVTAGLLDPRQFNAWSSERREAIRAGLKRGMQTGGAGVRDAVRAQMRSVFKVRRNSFVTSMQFRVLDRKTDRLPALLIGSKIPWLGLHDQGGTVSGNLLIPLLPGRIGPQRFKAVIEGLLQSGNAFFIRKNGRVILMAENIKDNRRELLRFKRAERDRTGAKRIQRGQEIPIAVRVRSVSLKRRLDLASVVQRALPRLAAAIERQWRDL